MHRMLDWFNLHCRVNWLIFSMVIITGIFLVIWIINCFWRASCCLACCLALTTGNYSVRHTADCIKLIVIRFIPVRCTKFIFFFFRNAIVVSASRSWFIISTLLITIGMDRVDSVQNRARSCLIESVTNQSVWLSYLRIG